MAGEYAVLGLGQFGHAVATSLARQGQPVLAVDQKMERVESLKNQVDAAVQADATDEDTLHSLEIDAMTTVVVAIGAHSTEASILTTALLSQMGVPRIVARSSTDLHARVLRTIGAHEVINPEGDMGERLANRLCRPNVLDQLQLGEAILAEVNLPESMIGHTLAEVDLRSRYDVSVIAIQRDGEIDANPRPDDNLHSGDVLVVLGEQASIDELSALA
jgi:trk system potassium uptake protein TrkA